MQTFLPYENFEESAYALDTRRLGKQRVETYQIMQALFGVKMVTSELIFTGEHREVQLGDDGDEHRTIVEPVTKRVDIPKSEWTIEKLENPGWKNHPATKMWRGHEWTLLKYQKACCEDWMENLGYEDTCFEKTLWLYFQCYDGKNDLGVPSWLGDEEFHRSHQSNLIRKDPDHYRKIFPGVPDDLPYIWPEA